MTYTIPEPPPSQLEQAEARVHELDALLAARDQQLETWRRRALRAERVNHWHSVAVWTVGLLAYVYALQALLQALWSGAQR